MTDSEALEILRGQGYAVGAPDQRTGTVRIWLHGSEHWVDVKPGRDLIYLAEGKISFEDLEPRAAPGR